jgi:hypothetical protein
MQGTSDNYVPHLIRVIRKDLIDIKKYGGTLSEFSDLELISLAVNILKHEAKDVYSKGASYS